MLLDQLSEAMFHSSSGNKRADYEDWKLILKRLRELEDSRKDDGAEEMSDHKAAA